MDPAPASHLGTWARMHPPGSTTFSCRHIRFEGRACSPARPRHRVTSPPARPRQPEPPLDASEEQFIQWLLAAAGLDRGSYRTRPLRRRLDACLRMLRVATAEQARQRLEREPELLDRAVSAMIIGVTEFLRDKPVFDALEHDILPRLLRQRDRVDVWSVACSDGPELYSIAMLLAERGCLDRARLLGTDCRRDAVLAAGRGTYGELAGLDEARARRWFTRDRRGWRIADELRQACDWRVEDVFGREGEGAWDLVLCRNLAIYLEHDWTLRLWSRLERALRPGGILVVGKAERPAGRFRQIGTCVYVTGER